MKYTDYTVIGHCKMCGKPVFTPVAWTGLNKDGSYKNQPKIYVCQCPQKITSTS